MEFFNYKNLYEKDLNKRQNNNNNFSINNTNYLDKTTLKK